jgi:hypothetical protein
MKFVPPCSLIAAPPVVFYILKNELNSCPLFALPPRSECGEQQKGAKGSKREQKGAKGSKREQKGAKGSKREQKGARNFGSEEFMCAE